MKSQLRIATMVVLTTLCLASAAVPALAGIKNLYDNGQPNDDTTAWTINFGYAVSNSFGLNNDSTITGFQYEIWAIPGDKQLSVDWTISSQQGGAGAVFGSGTATVGGNGLQGTLASQFVSSNAYGYEIDLETVTGLSMPVNKSGSPTDYWLTLQNATDSQLAPVYWDENSGEGCGGADGHGLYCSSLAWSDSAGTIPSEAFTVNGQTPEPSSFLLLGSGILGLAGLVRKRFFG